MPYRQSLYSGDGPTYSLITNNGYRGQIIFRGHEDFDHFILLLKRAATRYPTVSIIGFCLLETSFHLLLHEEQRGNIVRFMHSIGVAYGIYFNTRYEKAGKVFQGPYKDKLLGAADDIIRALSFIHKLPADEHQQAETYEWSSYRHYLRQSAPWIDKGFVTQYFATTSYLDDLRRVTQSQP